MKLLFVCGGTGGHINPAIAVAKYVKTKRPDAQIQFVGNPQGMEARLVPQAGFDFIPIRVKGFQRKLSVHNIKNNLQAVGTIFSSSKKAKVLLQSFKPDLVMGTGGYVSGPIVRKAAKMGIKTLTHEQNAFPGVANKLLSKQVDEVLLAVEEAKKYLAPNCRCVVTGNPVREEILFADRERCRRELGVGDRICIVSSGGSLGARRINEAVAELMAWHVKQGNIFHIHATGSYGVELMPELLQRYGVTEEQRKKSLDIREYIQDMDRCLAAADIVIGRAGAMTISELQAAGRASILIPSPNVAENHQYYNAKVLADHNAAILIEEKDLTGSLLCRQIEELAASPERIRTLGRNAQKMAILDSNERIYHEIVRLIGPG